MLKKMKYGLSGLTLFMMVFWSIPNVVFADPAWSIEGEYFEACTCNPGCPCLF